MEEKKNALKTSMLIFNVFFKIQLTHFLFVLLKLHALLQYLIQYLFIESNALGRTEYVIWKPDFK
jgi:hypothetical protein